MSDPSLFYPPDLKPALVTDEGNLKPSLVTDQYTSGTPTTAAELKPALVLDDGTLKPSLINPEETGLKQSLLKDGFSTPSPGDLIFDLNEDEEQILPDTGPEANNATLYSARAVTLNGTTNVGTFPATSASELAGNTRTIGVLFRVSALPAPGVAEVILSREDAGNGGYFIILRDNNKLGIVTKQDGLTSQYQSVENNLIVRTGVWNEVVINLIDGEVVDFSLNGESETTELTPPTGTYGDASTDFRLGARGNSSLFFTGDLAEVYIQDENGVDLFRADLSDHEAGSTDGLPILDRSGNGNHGVWTGGTSVNALGMSDPFQKLGAYEDRMFSVEASDDGVSIPIDANFFSGGNTISCDLFYFAGTPGNRIFEGKSSTLSHYVRVFYKTDGKITFRFAFTASDAIWTSVDPVDLSSTKRFSVYYNSDSVTNDPIIQIDGVTIALSEDTAPVGSSLTSHGTLILGNNVSGTRGWGGIHSDWVVGTSEYIGHGNTNADWEDQVGSNDGTVNGSPATVADYRRQPPQTMVTDGNKRMLFDGVGTSVNRSVSDFLISETSGKIKLSFLCESNGSFQALFGSSDTAGFANFFYVGITDSGQILVQAVEGGGNSDRVFSTQTGFDDGKAHELEIVSDGSAWSGLVDGVSITFTVDEGSNSGDWFADVTGRDNYFIGQLQRASNAIPLKGLIWDVSVENDSGTELFKVNGTGITDADWEDQVGSNDGTVNGSPANIFVPASTATPTQDALGNPIDDPLKPGETRPVDDVSYWVIADDASLDVTTEATWSFIVDGAELQREGGANEFVLHRYDFTNDKRSWGFLRSSTFAANDGKIRMVFDLDGLTPNEVQLDVTTIPQSDCHILTRYNGTAGTVEAWIDGTPATVTTVSGSIPASLFTTDIGARAHLDFGGNNPSDAGLRRVKQWNKALTDAEVAQINSKEGQYV